MADSDLRLPAIVREALAKPDPTGRAAYLDWACAGDPDLRRQVEAHLAADFEGPRADPTDRSLDATGPFEPRPLPPTVASPGGNPANAATATRDQSPRAALAPRLAPGTVLAGRYTLVELIGEGGMGSVYLAEQIEPVRRQVAVKLIRAGMDSGAVLARFDAERQALAVMDHPNIARVYDGGTTATGFPFFVMELVRGVPLTKYCDDRRLSVAARLELFVLVCQAAQHAHQKGIIHRDLKPGNVLVTEVDGRPTPKVIDFGVAKAIESNSTDIWLADAVVGTPAYMSPEQADPTAADIDTRTDVYALGVMLYELLAGSPPIDASQFRRGAVTEMLRMVREAEPPRPSTKLSTANDLPGIAARRSIDPTRLAKALKGELDWIVMKALDRDRARRYDTASALARDVQRFLADEIVEARPPSPGYRLRKLVRRHKGRVVAAGLVALALVGGLAGTSAGMVQARRARGAEAERAEAEKRERLRAEAAEADAQKRLAQVARANDLLGSIFTDLDPKEIAKRDRPLQAILVDKLDWAVAQLDGESTGEPLTVARTQMKFGLSLLALGEPTKATVVLEKARSTRQALLGPDDPETLTSMNYLAAAYQDAGKLDLAIPLFEETLRRRRSTLPPDDPDILMSMNNLASAYDSAGRFDLAVPQLVETLKLVKAKHGPEDPRSLTSTSNLAEAYRAAGKPDLAVPLHEEALRLRRAVLGPNDPDTLVSMNNLAMTYVAAGRLDVALPLHEETVKLAEARLGGRHSITLAAVNNLALAYSAAGKHHLALPRYEETLAIQKDKFGPDHPGTIASMNNLAAAYQDAGRIDRAIPLIEETLKLMNANLGADHPNTLIGMHNLAHLYRIQKQFDKSIPLFDETLKLKEKKLGRNHPSTLSTVANFGLTYLEAGRFKDAVPLLEEADRSAKEHPQFRWVRRPLIDACQKAGENARLATLLLEQLPETREALPKESAELAGVLAQIGLGLLDQKKWAEAEPHLRECLVIREKQEPDDWRTFNTKSMLGAALLGQKRYADAGPLLLAGYEGMKAREKAIPPQANSRIPDAIDRLIVLFSATNKPGDVEKWQQERAKYPDASPPAKK